MERAAGRTLVCCFDKWKGSLSAAEAGAAVCRALRPLFGDSAVRVLSLSDGGEGFLSVLSSATCALRLRRTAVEVCNAAGEVVEAEYGSDAEHRLAVVEMAGASGLQQLGQQQRNPLYTTTYGTGQLLLAAAAALPEGGTLFVGLGGSATNDGGLGALQAMGVAVELDAQRVQQLGAELERVPRSESGAILMCGALLGCVERLSWTRPAALRGVEVTVACDVDNPFVGPRGAVHTFAEQKGAVTAEMRQRLEHNMQHLAAIYKRDLGCDVASMEGAGAAGGLAGGLVAGVAGAIERGIDIIAKHVRLAEHLRGAALVVTGEGSFDSQTEGGKVVSKVMELTHELRVPLLIVCGRTEHGMQLASHVKVLDLLSHYSEKQCMENAAQCIEDLLKQNLQRIASMLEDA